MVDDDSSAGQAMLTKQRNTGGIAIGRFNLVL